MYRITSEYLQQESFRSRPHRGIDLKMEIGEPLRAIKSGVAHVKDFGNVNAGKTILIEAEDGRTYIYGHLSEFSIREGQHVDVGQLIGYAGNSGFSTGSHLHFGVREGSNFIDPSPYIDAIQNMNNPKWLASLTQTPEVVTHSQSFMEILNSSSSVYSDFFQSLKFNLIYLIHSIDYTVFIQYLKYLFQFIS